MLIDEWRKAYKLLSVQANSIGLAIAATYGAMYEQLKETFPPQWMAAVTGAVFAAGIICRVISQAPKDDPKE
jgi:xanthine/uracil permease